MVPTIGIITYNQNVVCNGKNASSLKISSIFCWNMLQSGTTPNGSLVNLYLPNSGTNLVRYDNLLSSLRL